MAFSKLLSVDRYRDGANRDLLLFAMLLSLAFLGILILYPASAVVSERELNDPEFFVKRQLTWLMVGVVSLYIVAAVPVTVFRKLALPGMFGILLMLGLVFIPGIGHSVSSDRDSFHRWIGFGPVTIQPSEFAKIAVMVYMAHILSRNGRLRSEMEIRKLIPATVLTGIVLAAIVVEPQYGTTICILGALIMLVYVSGFPMLRLTLLFLAALPLLLLLAVLWEYRLDRFRVWLDPYAYRFSGGYQLVMSFRAFKEGGLPGEDLASGIAHRYLTYGHTDFILSLFAEDYGLIGVMGLILLYIALTWRTYALLRYIREPFPFLLGAGSLLMLISQTILNMAVVTGLLPTTGVSLPFVSYGGSSLVTSLIFGGILFNVSRYSDPRLPEGSEE